MAHKPLWFMAFSSSTIVDLGLLPPGTQLMGVWLLGKSLSLSEAKRLGQRNRLHVSAVKPKLCLTGGMGDMDNVTAKLLEPHIPVVGPLCYRERGSSLFFGKRGEFDAQ
ncbi:hypothetical protein CIHG_02622 [Coccidioides immitis H538.4]|uniref:Uncharacterized protein n=2 Tax=Coccidioides immitis TaxID=5501 RepID=A0A0J8UC94_COCIT|nr:hypothetical protein CIRG_02949 [Coccidioides immitis RMSCC 2394]KMU84838.1 hypothetical protein CIHG_02622 [Coccidioides immitis H538.4]